MNEPRAPFGAGDESEADAHPRDLADALRQSEAHYRRLVETSPYGIFVLDSHGRIREANPAFASLLQRPVQELVGMHFAEVIAEHEVERIGERFAARLRGEDVTSEYEVAALLPTGEQRLGRVAITSIVENGEVVGAHGVVRNITEERAAQQELRRNRERLALALESAEQGFWDADLKAGTVTLDARAARLVGLGTSEVQCGLGEWFETVHPDDRTAIRAAAELHLAGESPALVLEHRVATHDGEVRWIQARGRLIERDAEGEPWRLVGTHTDVTARKTADERIRLLSRAVEQSPASIVMTDAGGTIVYVNQKFTEVTGYTREEALGQTPRILKSGKQSPEFYRDLWARITSGAEWHGELENRHKDGTLFTERAHISPVKDGSGRVTHFIAVKENITALKSLEDQLRQSQKMEAIGRLAGGIAHDFNNMLLVIQGFATLLQAEVEMESIAAEYVQEIEQAARRSAALTRQLLAFSRKQILKPQIIDLNETLRLLEKMLRRVIGEDVTLLFELADDLPPVRVDPGQIEQVVLNLAVNARDAMPEGGRLEVVTQVSSLHGSGGWAASRRPPAGRYASIEVRDTGSGMDADTLAHIFEPFFTTKGVGKGTGLGLATVYGIVRQSGGYIDVDSAPGEGTTFRILLPAADDAVPAPGPTAEQTSPNGAGETLLLVEDEVAVQRLAQRVLERAGYTVLCAAGGAEAMRIAADPSQHIDLLVTDVIMPDLNGRELAEALHRARPDLPVLFISGYTDDRILHNTATGDSRRFLEKPFQPADLLERVRDILSGR